MPETKKIVLFDIDNTLFNTLKLKQTNLEIFSLYEEVYGVLEELSKIVDLGIFSQGDLAFQKKKLLQTNIEKYFLAEHTHIVSEKFDAVDDLVKRYQHESQVFLIDDFLKALSVIKQKHPSIFTIWMKRGEYADSQSPIAGFTPDAIVENLKEIIPLIANN